MISRKHIKGGTIAICVFVLCVSVSFLAQGTGDSGDSIMHYLIAKHSWGHPSLFLNHWGKPLFTLVSSPFAQFSFIGMKIFNSLIVSLICFVGYLATKELQFKSSWLVPIYILSCPLFFVLIFSGLTEYLFAFGLLLAVYCSLKMNYNIAAIIVSSLPFVRSEGLVIGIVFAVYFMVNKKYRALPFLLAFTVLYSIVGFGYYDDLFWVYTKIPYQNLSDYGAGKWNHFIQQLYYVIGLPAYVLLIIGGVSIVVDFFRKKKTNDLSILFYLVAGCFSAILVAHSIFWSLGVFHSAGLKRVLIAVVPLAAIIAVYGINKMSKLLNNNPFAKKVVTLSLIVYLVVFPFTPNPAAINFNKEFSLSQKQIVAKEIALFVTENYPNEKIYCSYPYFGIILIADWFEVDKRQNIKYSLSSNLSKGVVIWDNWFSEKGEGIPKKMLNNKDGLTFIKSYSDYKGEEVFRVYEKK